MKYKKEVKEIQQILREAFDKYIKTAYEKDSFSESEKGYNDLVTTCDVDVENYIIERIKEEFGDTNFVSEEVNSNGQLKGRTWIIDPIDGTINFANNIKLFGIQIALVVENEPVFSAIYLPYLEEMYYAVKGVGAFCNGVKIKVSNNTNLFKSLVTYGDFAKESNSEGIRLKQIKILSKLYNKVRKIKMLGAACVDFAFLASGKTGAHVLQCKNLWDLIPGYFLAVEAGAVSNYSMDNPVEFIVVAANEEVLNDILENMNDIINE